MSNTKRFKKDRWLEADVLKELDRIGPVYYWEWIPIDRNSEKGRKKLARFHSDKKDYWMNWRGPSWFHNVFSQRPHRRKAKRELQKFLLNPEHEVIIETMPKREYWL